MTEAVHLDAAAATSAAQRLVGLGRSVTAEVPERISVVVPFGAAAEAAFAEAIRLATALRTVAADAAYTNATALITSVADATAADQFPTLA